MRIHWLQHVPFEGLGSIAAWAAAQRCPISGTRLYKGQSPPALSSFDMLIVMGGPMGVHDERIHPWLADEKRYINKAMDAGKRVLGICLGAQLIACATGARVAPNPVKEIGWFPVEKTNEAQSTPVGEAMPDRATVFHWHGDTFDIPTGAVHLARSQGCVNQAFAIGQRIIGLQYHLETTRKTAKDLIRHCAGELIDAPFIQTPSQMLSRPDRFVNANHEMDRLLNAFVNLDI